MTLKGFLIILIFLTICAIVSFFVVDKYPPKVPEILITYTPVKSIDVYLDGGRMYAFDNVRYIRDEKTLKVYMEDETETIFPMEKIIAVKIKKEDSKI